MYGIRDGERLQIDFLCDRRIADPLLRTPLIGNDQVARSYNRCRRYDRLRPGMIDLGFTKGRIVLHFSGNRPRSDCRTVRSLYFNLVAIKIGPGSNAPIQHDAANRILRDAHLKDLIGARQILGVSSARRR